MFEANDHPTVRNLLRTGYPDGHGPKEITCPTCESAPERFYENMDGIIIGCESCLTCRYYDELETEGY